MTPLSTSAEQAKPEEARGLLDQIKRDKRIVAAIPADRLAMYRAELANAIARSLGQ